MSCSLSAFGICGWSGSGKTTLIAELARRLCARGLDVAVVKHDAHGPQHDPADKDSARLFEAGATVAVMSPGETFERIQPWAAPPLEALVAELNASHDVVLCEGHKRGAFARKIWLARGPGDEPPSGAGRFDAVLGPEEDRVSVAEVMVREWLEQEVKDTPLCAGILIGGASRRMGRPKQLLEAGGRSWLENIVDCFRNKAEQVVLLGAGPRPSSLSGLLALPDVPGKDGPLGGILAAMRWRPDAAWLIAACDLPRIRTEALDWLLAQRAPGVRAILPRLAGERGVEPLLALYDFRARRFLEEVNAPSRIQDRRGVLSSELPPELAAAWRDADTPEEAAELSSEAS